MGLVVTLIDTGSAALSRVGGFVDLSTAKNLQKVMKILRDDHNVTRDEFSLAVEKAFDKDLPDALYTTPKEDLESIAAAWNAVDEVLNEKANLSDAQPVEERSHLPGVRAG